MQYSSNSNGEYVHNFVQSIVAALPTIIGAILILVVSYLIAKGISTAVHKLLEVSKLNSYMHSGKSGNIIQKAVPDPNELLTKTVYWIIFLFGLSVAVSFLGIPALVDLVHGIYSYLPNVLAALLIFLVAGALSTAVAKLVNNTMGDTPTGKVVGAAAPVLVMVIAVFMILNQLRIAPAIVTITYAALLGGTALGMALAFGLGGRESASKLLNELYTKGRQNKDRVAQDFAAGAKHAKSTDPRKSIK